MESKSSEEHRYTLLTDKTKLKPENKFMPLPDQTQQKSDNTSLLDKKKNWRVGRQTNIGIHLFQVKLNQI